MNTLNGTIAGIESSEMISLISIDVAGDMFSSIILEGTLGPVTYRPGDPVTIVFKETEVGIAKNLSGAISFRNRFIGTIREIEPGAVLTRIILDYKAGRIDSIISTKSTGDMDLKKADQVEWLVKTTEVSLMGRTHAR